MLAFCLFKRGGGSICAEQYAFLLFSLFSHWYLFLLNRPVRLNDIYFSSQWYLFLFSMIFISPLNIYFSSQWYLFLFSMIFISLLNIIYFSWTGQWGWCSQAPGLWHPWQGWWWGLQHRAVGRLWGRWGPWGVLHLHRGRGEGLEWQ